MQRIVIIPLLIPLITAIITLLAWNRRTLQRALSVCGAGLLLIAALLLLHTVNEKGILVMQVGNWPAPFGISIVVDLFSGIMVVMAGLMGTAVAIYALASTDIEHENYGFHPLFHILLLGVCGSFTTGDIFNLYVWFEVMLIASFVLLALGGHRDQMEGALKYVTLNLIASAFFLAGVGILYGVAGTLNMADLARYLPVLPQSGLITVIAMLFLIAFGIKSALFPMFFWLPASYHTPPVAVSAIFAGLLTKVGIYALIRVFTLLFIQDVGFTHKLILIIAGLTMVTGVLGAIAQNDVRRLLSFHIISQVGYMILGLGLFTPLALAGSIFYIVHNIIVKTNLFLVSGVVARLERTLELKKLGGLYHSAPILSLLFVISAFSLAGIPPLSGFWAKLAVVWASLQVGHYAFAAIALVVSLLTLYSMTKIWANAFWGERPAAAHGGNHSEARLSLPAKLGFYAPMAALALIALCIGFVAMPFFSLATRAAEQLLDPAAYIAAVLGGAP